MLVPTQIRQTRRAWKRPRRLCSCTDGDGRLNFIDPNDPKIRIPNLQKKIRQLSERMGRTVKQTAAGLAERQAARKLEAQAPLKLKRGIGKEKENKGAPLGLSSQFLKATQELKFEKLRSLVFTAKRSL